MQIKSYSSFKSRTRSDLIVYPYVKTKKNMPEAASEYSYESDSLKSSIKCGDFTGSFAEYKIFYDANGKDKRVATLGFGNEEEITAEVIRKGYATIVKECHFLKIETLSIVMPNFKHLPFELVAKSIAEAVFLTNYSYTSSKEVKRIKNILLVGGEKTGIEIFEETYLIAEGVYLARDLVNGSSQLITPTYLSKVAKDLAKENKKLKVKSFDKAQIEKEKMGLLLAVNQGSTEQPAFIILEYHGNPQSKDHTVLVGKGVTYDTGGVNLKPTGSLETMRCDMAGAAAVLGIMKVLSRLKMQVNVTGVIPATENGIDANSFKPGDVYTGYAGKSVEIGNTDAEGRLILADAIAYAVENLNPTRIIDFATLTGAMVIALGNITTGLMSNDKQLSDALIFSGEETYERLWRFPLFEDYKKLLKSDIADIKNIGGRGAGSITAALFLQEFVKNTPWAHLDIAGTAFLEKENGYLPKNGTGVGVRLIIDFLKNLEC